VLKVLLAAKQAYFLALKQPRQRNLLVKSLGRAGVGQFLLQELDSTPALLNSLSGLNSSSNDLLATVT